jgi:hypothetical protein
MPTSSEELIRATPYNCKVEGHIMEDHWWPKTRTSKYRHCVVPKCKFTQEMEARG